MDLNITTNIKSIQRGLSKTAKRQVPFAIATTLTKLAFEAMQQEKQQAPKYLDRPTPFTVKGFRYKKANKRNLMSVVYIDGGSSSRSYMNFAIEGGISRPKKSALVHPAKNSKLNKYGNLPRNYVKKALANKSKFFSGIPKGMTGDESSGIWQRYGPKITSAFGWLLNGVKAVDTRQNSHFMRSQATLYLVEQTRSLISN